MHKQCKVQRTLHKCVPPLLIALLLAACGGKPNSLAGVFPGADAFPDWTPAGEVQVFDGENLYDLVNGQAEAFFAYGFERVAVRRYESARGATLHVEVWQLATPADAYGLFTTSIVGTPAAIGNDGDADPGRRISFWQDRYHVDMYAHQQLPGADLQILAQAVSARLPSGGKRPALVDRLPVEGLATRSTIFFHEEISIQSELWLGGENLLGLSQETDGVLARYEVGGGVAQLLLVQYPDAEAASAGLAALEGDQVNELVSADVHDTWLGAVFGRMDVTTAGKLLTEALGDR